MFTYGEIVWIYIFIIYIYTGVEIKASPLARG